MHEKSSPDVLVIGGGVAGCAAAYYLAKSGVRVGVVDRDGIARHSSGLAAGGINPLEGDQIPGPLAELARISYRLHMNLWEELKSLSHVEFDGRIVPWIRIALSEEDMPALHRSFAAFVQAPGFSAKWLDPKEVIALEPRISQDVIAGVYMYGNGAVDSHRFTLALMTAAEKMGATFSRAMVTGVRGVKGGSLEVMVDGEAWSAKSVVLAAGPWSGKIFERAGVQFPVSPLKGQIIRLDPPGPAYRYDIAYPSGEAHPKPDGLVWIGATVEEAGFDTDNTDSARLKLTADAVKAIPGLELSKLVKQTACLRPVTADGMPLISKVDGYSNMYVSSGAGKKGILLGPVMGQAIAELITEGTSKVDIDAFKINRYL